MISIGSNVIYGANGIYKVEDIREETFCGKPQKYYVLSLLDQHRRDKIFIPCDNENLVSQMKRILSKEEICALIKEVPSEPMEWIADTRSRNEHFKEILARADRLELMHLSKTIYQRKIEMSAQGKKIFLSDENALAKAEKILFEEFSMVLDIKREDIIPFIIEQTKN